MSNPLVAFSATHHVRESCLCLHTQRAARALARHFDAAFRPMGLTSGQFSLIMSLNRPAPASLGGVASLLAMDRTTLTAALKPLERRGLVTVLQDEKDRRGRLLELTAEGQALLARALPIWQRAHAEAEALLSAQDAEPLRTSLRALERQTAARPSGKNSPRNRSSAGG